MTHEPIDQRDYVKQMWQRSRAEWAAEARPRVRIVRDPRFGGFIASCKHCWPVMHNVVWADEGHFYA